MREVTAKKNLHNDAFVTSLAQKPASKGDIANVLQNIVSASDDVSKIVNKNGEPMVVYHRTPNEFTTFDPEKIGASTDAGAFGSGSYLSPADFGSLYGKNLMPQKVLPHEWTHSKQPRLWMTAVMTHG